MTETPSRPHQTDIAWAGTGAMIVIAMYLWIVTAGYFTVLPPSRSYVALLAFGFSQGQTSYPRDVPDWVLKLPDPYDPLANHQFRISTAHDMVLFRGRLYASWGPVPSLVVWGVSAVTRRPFSCFTDEVVCFGFTVCLLAASTVAAVRLRRRFFPQVPGWLMLPCVLAVGMAAPVPYMMARPAVYEVAIASAQFFLVAGLLCAWIGVDGQGRLTWTLAAGISWALALGCRVSLAPAIAVLVLLTIWRFRRTVAAHARRTAIAAIFLGAPTAAAIGALLCYNYARFGSFTEFGSHYQLAEVNVHATPSLLSFHYVLFNLGRYLFGPPWLEQTFPFLIAPSEQLANIYGYEALVGLIFGVPFIWYVYAAVRFNDPTGTGRWLVITLALAAGLGIFPSLMVPGSTMRYLNDAVPSLSVLASIGFLRAIDKARRRKASVVTAGIIIVALTVMIGFLLAVRGYLDRIATFNPDLWHTLRSIRL